jgi:hypothetical protein
MQAELRCRRLVGRRGASCSGAAARASPRGSFVSVAETGLRVEQSDRWAGEMQCADELQCLALAAWLACLVRRYPGIRTGQDSGIHSPKYMWTSRGDGGGEDG